MLTEKLRMTMSPAISIALLLLSAGKKATFLLPHLSHNSSIFLRNIFLSVVVKSWESPEDETEEKEDDSSAELNHDMKERADHDAEEV